MIDLDLSVSEAVIRAATVDDLIAQLFNPSPSLGSYTRTFILTYRAFISPAELFHKVVSKYLELTLSCFVKFYLNRLTKKI